MALGGAREEEPLEQDLFMLLQDDLQIARPAQPAEPTESSSTSSVRCVGGRTVRPSQREEESPSTACLDQCPRSRMARPDKGDRGA